MGIRACGSISMRHNAQATSPGVSRRGTLDALVIAILCTMIHILYYICVYDVCIYVSDTGIYIYIYIIWHLYIWQWHVLIYVYIYIYGRYVGYKPLTNWDAHPSRELGIMRSLVFRCAWRCPFAVYTIYVSEYLQSSLNMWIKTKD